MRSASPSRSACRSIRRASRSSDRAHATAIARASATVGQLAEGPSDRGAAVLLGHQVGAPVAAEGGVPLDAKDRRRAHQPDREEGVERHHPHKQQQPHRVRRTRRPGVHPGDDPGEQVARQQEVQRHQQVAQVALQHRPEQRRVVEDDHAADEVDGGHQRVGEEPQVARVQTAVEPLPRTPAAVVAWLEGAQGQRAGAPRTSRIGTAIARAMCSAMCMLNSTLL